MHEPKGEAQTGDCQIRGTRHSLQQPWSLGVEILGRLGNLGELGGMGEMRASQSSQNSQNSQASHLEKNQNTDIYADTDISLRRESHSPPSNRS